MTFPRIFRTQAARIFAWVFLAGANLGHSPAQEFRFSLDIHETATTEHRTISATGYRPTASPWVVERSLSMTPGGEGLWFPFYQEDGSFADSGPIFPDGTRLSPMNFTLRVLPPLPSPPPASPSSGVPRARYLYGHTTLQLAADGAVYASWPSLDNSGTMAHTIFPADPVPELNLLNPDSTASNQNRPVFGVGIQNQAETGSLPPLTISYAVTAGPIGQPFPSGLVPLGEKDGFIREGLKAFGPAIREDCWPVFGPPGPPPPPPTLNDRSFYRVKTLPALHDSNENGFPDELEGLYSDLLISEVCYVSLTAVAAHQPHTFLPAGEDSVLQPAFLNRPPDWVEILNPTGHDISTAGYFFSDKAGDPTRFPLPASVIIPAYGTLILLLTDDPHPLFSTEGDPNSMVRKCWVPFRLKDEGETVYINQLNAENIPTRVDTFSPPWTATYALTGYTAGRVPRADGTWQSVFLPAASPNLVNQGWGLTRALSVPLISEQPAGGGTSAPARSRLFRDPSTLPRITLSHPDPEAVITYTLDGSEPGPEDGIYEGPLEIHTTTVLRARAYAAGAIPSPVVTRTYISSEGVLTQSIPPVWPLIDNSSRTAIDPAVSAAYGHTVPPARAGYTSTRTILDQLEARPAVFLTIDPAGAIIEGGPGGDPETRIAFEWVDPARPEDYRQENAFLQETGAASTGVTPKKSYDILFKGSVTLTGKSSWDGPVLENGKSSLFPGLPAAPGFPAIPGSPVTKFKRLLLRNPAQASFPSPGLADRLYISDAWAKETQRALSGPGFVTCQRRWVHVFINGYYWGVYDLEEHLDADTVSAHILAAIPSPTAEQKEQLNASNILFGKPTQLPDYAPATVEEQWWFNTVVPNALAVRGGSPPGTPAAAFSVLADGLGIVPSGGLHIDRYIDYICTIQVTEDQDLSEDNIRVWRHPVDLKWRCIAWDGDYIGWYGNHTFFPSFLNSDTFDLDRIGFYQLAPHNAVKFNPDYASAFSARLQTHLAGPLSQAALAARFNALAEDFRLTLECEALRWGRNIAGSTEASTLWSQNMIPIREAVTRPFAALPETPSTYNTLIKGGIQNGYLPTNFPYLPTSPP